jgi:4-hydroxy-tetrahydrodipicolinate reductase
MGKEIEASLNKDEFEIIGKFDIDNPVYDNLKELPDVAIEFTNPDTVIKNITFLSSKKINIVCGTTGWYSKTNEAKEIVSSSGTGFVYASNFSLGVNLFFNIIRSTGKLIGKFPQYIPSIEEMHHLQKLDKPSGTAIRIADYLKETMNSNKPAPINSIREGTIVGNHKVFFKSMSDSIIIEHDAKSRRGFAEGALLAAKFIIGKKGFFKFEDIFENLIS